MATTHFGLFPEGLAANRRVLRKRRTPRGEGPFRKRICGREQVPMSQQLHNLLSMELLERDCGTTDHGPVPPSRGYAVPVQRVAGVEYRSQPLLLRGRRRLVSVGMSLVFNTAFRLEEIARVYAGCKARQIVRNQ